jgi:general nucleoside transport system permease protein
MTALRSGMLRWSMTGTIGLGGFALFLLMVGANPLGVFNEMRQAMLGDTSALGDVLVKATPIVLCALAVAIPARAGLWNLGAEGQLTMGLVGSAGMALALPSDLATPLALVAMGLAGGLAGALWGAVAGTLRVTVRLNEAISSLLLNYIALRILDWVVNGPWKDPSNLGFPGGTELSEAQRLPTFSLFGNESVHRRVHRGRSGSVCRACHPQDPLGVPPTGRRRQPGGRTAQWYAGLAGHRFCDGGGWCVRWAGRDGSADGI